jgi:hypothetical protein
MAFVLCLGCRKHVSPLSTHNLHYARGQVRLLDVEQISAKRSAPAHGGLDEVNDKRVTTTSLPLNPFSFHPFANIWRAIFKPHAIRFTTHEKAHYLAIDHANLF